MKRASTLSTKVHSYNYNIDSSIRLSPTPLQIVRKKIRKVLQSRRFSRKWSPTSFPWGNCFQVRKYHRGPNLTTRNGSKISKTHRHSRNHDYFFTLNGSQFIVRPSVVYFVSLFPLLPSLHPPKKNPRHFSPPFPIFRRLVSWVSVVYRRYACSINSYTRISTWKNSLRNVNQPPVYVYSALWPIAASISRIYFSYTTFSCSQLNSKSVGCFSGLNKVTQVDSIHQAHGRSWVDHLWPL